MGGEVTVVSEAHCPLGHWGKETTMPLTMKEKQAVTKQLAFEYKRAGKKAKASEGSGIGGVRSSLLVLFDVD